MSWHHTSVIRATLADLGYPPVQDITTSFGFWPQNNDPIRSWEKRPAHNFFWGALDIGSVNLDIADFAARFCQTPNRVVVVCGTEY
jgi:hypothetical protein